MVKRKVETDNEKDLVYVAQVLIRKYCGDKNFNFNDLKIVSFGTKAITFLYKNSICYITELKDDYLKLTRMEYDNRKSEYLLKELSNIPISEII